MPRMYTRTAVKVVNFVLDVVSALASWSVALLGLLLATFSSTNPDHVVAHRELVLGLLAIATFLTIPMVCWSASEKLARQGRGGSIFVSLIPLLLVAAVALGGMWFFHRTEVPLTAAFSDPAIAHKIIGAAPPGWRLVRMDQDQLPRGQHFGDGYRNHWHGGEELTLTGPTKVVIEAAPKDIEAVEALELWILPGTYPDGSLDFDLFGYQMAEQIFRDDRVSIYALTSRFDGKNCVDSYISDVYSEKSVLKPSRSGLPISWKSYETDIPEALRH